MILARRGEERRGEKRRRGGDDLRFRRNGEGEIGNKQTTTH
jgi:hypothetical protein